MRAERGRSRGRIRGDWVFPAPPYIRAAPAGTTRRPRKLHLGGAWNLPEYPRCILIAQTAKLGGHRPPNPSPLQATASAPAAMRSMRNAPTDVRPTMHKAPTDVHAMPPAEAGIGIVVVVPIAAIRPSPATKVMRASGPAVDLVGEVGIFDGVTQAVSATEGNGRSRFGEHAEDHGRRSCNGECKDLHGFSPDRTCRSPHRTLIHFLTN